MEDTSIDSFSVAFCLYFRDFVPMLYKD